MGIGSSIILILMLSAGVILIIKGTLGCGSQRFDQYISSLENGDYADVKKLALLS
ncbi:MAG: hypothetical protein V8R14_05230 [Clostridia bacterium]